MLLSDRIRVAITGGGLAGASLFHALLEHVHLDVHIFEAAESFKEPGAAIEITRNGMLALDLISPSATRRINQAGAIAQLGYRFRVAQGSDAGNLAGELGSNGERLLYSVHRAAFLREFYAGAPSDRMHASKQLQSVDEQRTSGTLLLRFADGTSHECDLLIGADGTQSRVRPMLLGDMDSAVSAIPTKWWSVEALVPYSEPHSELMRGLIDLEDNRRIGWIGDRSFMSYKSSSRGNFVHFTFIGHDDGKRKTDQGHTTVAAQDLRDMYSSWPPSLATVVDKLLCDQPYQVADHLRNHRPAHSYTNAAGNMCIVGDAAHTSTPWQASGAGMSIEDTLILSTLLGRSKRRGETRTALQIYDRLRRQRTQKAVESSREVGLLLTNTSLQAGLDASKLREQLPDKWNFILNFDVANHREEAIHLLAISNEQ